MCKIKGKHSYTCVDTKTKEQLLVEMNYVGYATFVKANDAVIFWIVMDETENQSKSKEIELYADRIAESLRGESEK